MLPIKVGKCVTKHWDVRKETRKCMGKRERLGRHYAGHQEITSSATSARAPGFDYGEDFEQSCHLSYNAARHQENQVAGQVFKILYIYYILYIYNFF